MKNIRKIKAQYINPDSDPDVRNAFEEAKAYFRQLRGTGFRPSKDELVDIAAQDLSDMKGINYADAVDQVEQYLIDLEIGHPPEIVETDEFNFDPYEGTGYSARDVE